MYMYLHLAQMLYYIVGSVSVRLISCLNFRIINVTGPSNTRRYTVAVYFRGERLATGVNYGIQSAEMEAAAKALIDHKGKLI